MAPLRPAGARWAGRTRPAAPNDLPETIGSCVWRAMGGQMHQSPGAVAAADGSDRGGRLGWVRWQLRALPAATGDSDGCSDCDSGRGQ